MFTNYNDDYIDLQFQVKVLPARVLEPWGQRVILFCYIRSNDNYEVVWLHNNLPIASFESNIVVVNTYQGSTLDIPFLDTQEVGTYTCRVTANNYTLQDVGEVVMIGKVNVNDNSCPCHAYVIVCSCSNCR